MARVADSPRRRWYRQSPGERWWFALVLLPGLLTAALVATQGHAIESDLQRDAEASLEAAGLAGVTVTMTGRNASLKVPTGQSEETAVEAAASVEGIGDVDVEHVAGSAAEARACDDLRARIDRVTGIRFAGSSTHLSGAGAGEVSALARLLAKCPSARITVDGHADASVLGNSTVSLRRAEAVRSALIRAGVHASRVGAHGYGDTFPASKDDTAAGRAANNRVTIELLEE